MNTERFKLMFAVITKIWTNNESQWKWICNYHVALTFFRYCSKCSEDIAKMILMDISFSNHTLSGSSFACSYFYWYKTLYLELQDDDCSCTCYLRPTTDHWVSSHFVQKPFRTKTTSYKGDHFVQRHRSHFEQGFFVRGGTWIFTYTRRGII